MICVSHSDEIVCTAERFNKNDMKWTCPSNEHSIPIHEYIAIRQTMLGSAVVSDANEMSEDCWWQVHIVMEGDVYLCGDDFTSIARVSSRTEADKLLSEHDLFFHGNTLATKLARCIVTPLAD